VAVVGAPTVCRLKWVWGHLPTYNAWGVEVHSGHVGGRQWEAAWWWHVLCSCRSRYETIFYQYHISTMKFIHMVGSLSLLRFGVFHCHISFALVVLPFSSECGFRCELAFSLPMSGSKSGDIAKPDAKSSSVFCLKLDNAAKHI